MTDTPKKHGRPTSYTPEIGNAICDQIALGKSLVTVCKEMKLGYSTVMEWLTKDQAFAEKYAQAREAQADYLADEIMELADEPPQMTTNKHGAKVVDSGWVQNQRSRIDTRKWLAGKMKPKKYGDRVALAGVEDAPLKVVPDDKLESRIAELLGKAGTAAVAGRAEPKG